MTSRDKLHRDLEDISDDLLGDLSPEARIRLFAKAKAEGDCNRAKWLRETIPKRTYRGADPEYRNKALGAIVLSQQATYGLHISYMEYRIAEERAQNALLNAQLIPDLPAFEEFEEAIGPEAILDRALQQVRAAGSGHYIVYQANKRFAEEYLGMELGEFLALSPPGWLPDMEFGTIVDCLETQGDIADPVVVVADDGNPESIALDDAVQRAYDSLVRGWDDDDWRQDP